MIALRAAAMAAFLAAGAAAMPALAQDQAWMVLGERDVSAQADHHTLNVHAAYVSREIMFCVETSPVRLVSADLAYQGGETQTVQLSTRVRAGGCSRIFGLRGRNRQIDTIAFSVDAAQLGGATAKVQVLAR
jgi:hypothetical protein